MLAQFWRNLRTAENASLLLDYDGTLAPFRVERDKAVPYPGVREKLASIRQETATRVVIISGRAIDDLLPLLGLEPPPEIWGCHGWEHLEASGRRPTIHLPHTAQAGLAEAAAWIEEQKLGHFSEIKPASVAIHWRGLPEGQIKDLQALVQSGFQPIETRYSLEVHPFNGGLELRCPGKSKGTAIRSILESLNPVVPVAFLGDDLTDEDGFQALEGRGLSVLVNKEPRQTRADIQITPPDELLNFLDDWYRNSPRKKKA